ncbi:hypothetical protein J1605_019650 [Eschrichtius robustus]|uniref:Uncharacterized protein n=1 Tax=Eschrichtius robustus TaxID=9764 RepID=A0AB34HHZ1_ESCRO|nr:hypothetical protein J1605_019650 [Eschrichtius robustus]
MDGSRLIQGLETDPLHLGKGAHPQLGDIGHTTHLLCVLVTDHATTALLHYQLPQMPDVVVRSFMDRINADVPDSDETWFCPRRAARLRRSSRLRLRERCLPENLVKKLHKAVPGPVPALREVSARWPSPDVEGFPNPRSLPRHLPAVTLPPPRASPQTPIRHLPRQALSHSDGSDVSSRPG